MLGMGEGQKRVNERWCSGQKERGEREREQERNEIGRTVSISIVILFLNQTPWLSEDTNMDKHMFPILWSLGDPPESPLGPAEATDIYLLRSD